MTLPPDVHLCLDCQGEPLPEKRMSEGHVAFRFGDFGCLVYFGEHEVSNFTTEAMAGPAPDGWIMRLCAERHPCQRCGSEICMWLARGDVRVERVLQPV